jgi:hypothetical protein
LSHRESVSLTEEFDVPASALWELLIDWPAIIDWMPSGQIVRIEMDGEGVGSVRHLTTAQGVHIAERLDAADPETGTLDLSIVAPLPWGMSSYSARGTVVPLGSERCRLTWTGTFELPGSDADRQRHAQFMRTLYSAMFQGLRQATAGTP